MLGKRNFWLVLGLAGLLAGCDAGPMVTVSFARPFPADAPDLPGFPHWLRGQYQLADTAGSSLQLASETLVSQGIDSVGQLNGDTLADLCRGARLRRYRGWYYLSLPTDNQDDTTWQVQRLRLVKGQLIVQAFNPDSLRIRALSAATVRLRREAILVAN